MCLRQKYNNNPVKKIGPNSLCKYMNCNKDKLEQIFVLTQDQVSPFHAVSSLIQ